MELGEGQGCGVCELGRLEILLFDTVGQPDKQGVL